MTPKDLQSSVITFLRFPLIVGILFLHNINSTTATASMEFGNAGYLPVSYACREFFSQVLGNVAVPLFFFISGFLFFQNIDGFPKQGYLKKLKNRGKTLLIPYLFWNIAALLIYYVVRHTPALAGWFSTNPEYNCKYVLQALWGMPDKPLFCPIASQFWFVRDLMVAVVLTPVIFFYIRKAKVYGVLLLGVLWFFAWWFGVTGVSVATVFFFPAGAWFGVNRRSLIDDMSKVKYAVFILYPLLVLADLLTRQYAANPFIHNAGIIVGIAFWFNLVAYLLRTGKVSVNRFLAASSFFVFAIHEPFLQSKIHKVLYVIFNPQSDLLITALYFLIVLATVLIALGLYYLLRRFMPKFTAVITGGR
ncbi:MAG: acyltransferase [Prevotellaceae bacterium]|nr:acyltransferase [Prevotellaceae bacterium]